MDPAALAGDDARIAFWISLYNAILIEELERHPRTGSVLRHRKMFGSTRRRVGEHEYSLDVIEHGVLRRNARPPARIRRTLGRGDPRLAVMPSRLEPRVHFALNCGAVSCPPVRPYHAERLNEELDDATRAYIRAETVIDRDRGRVELPYLMRLYGRDFGSRASRLEFAVRYLADDDAAWARQHDAAIGYGRFDWTLASS